MVVLYSVRLTKQARTDLESLDKAIASRVLRRMRWLADNFDSISPQPLTGQWHEYLKLRVGDYRIIYRIDDEVPNTLIIEFVRHRREVYK